jgi:uncharacterized protein (TIGR02466 family)
MPEMKINPIFASFLVQANLDIDHDKVADWACSQSSYAVDNSTKVSVDVNNKDPLVKELFDQAQKVFDFAHKQTGLKDSKKQKIDNCWVNLDYNLRTSVSHMHPGSHFVGVYYPKVDEGSGSLLLYNPVTPVAMIYEDSSAVETSSIYTHTGISIPPRKGLFIVFPSYLYHQVYDNNFVNDDQKRISIAINTTMVDR